jgi:hypothetical protein
MRMSKLERAWPIIKWTLLAVVVTSVTVVVIQVGARLIFGKNIKGVAIAIGVPVAFLALNTIRSIRRRPG